MLLCVCDVVEIVQVRYPTSYPPLPPHPPLSSVVRGSIARRFAAALREVYPVLKAAMDVGNDVDRLDTALATARSKLGRLRFCIDFEPPILAAARDLRDKLIEWRHLADRIAPLLARPVTEVFLPLGAAVARAEDIMSIPHTAAHDAIVKRARDALDKCASVRIDPEASEALWLLDVDRMAAVLDEAAKYAYVRVYRLPPCSRCPLF